MKTHFRVLSVLCSLFLFCACEEVPEVVPADTTVPPSEDTSPPPGEDTSPPPGEDTGEDTGEYAPLCGNGILDAGEACDDPETPWLCFECEFTDCSEETDWGIIAASLADYSDMLPAVTAKPLETDWEDVAGFRLDTLAAETVYDDWEGDETACSVDSLWDASRVSVGPLLPLEDGSTECRVQLSNHKQDGLLYIANRTPADNDYPVSGEPGWVSWRFAIPEGHQATWFRYQHDMGRLFGSHPETCHENEQDEDGNCTRFLNEDDDWSEDVPAGVFLLWTVPNACNGWHITGPHAPANDLIWDIEETEIEVPAHLQEAPELTVTALVWHQYPGGCEEDYCIDATNTFFSEYSIGLGNASLQTEAVTTLAAEPPLEHPRLHGANETWYPEQLAYLDLPCREEPDYPENSDWGAITNVRNQWELSTLGGASCIGEKPETLYDHEFASLYLSGKGPGDDWSDQNVVQLLHLIRTTRACHALGGTDCPFTSEEVETLIPLFIDHEMALLPEESWYSYSFGFDLFTTPPMRRWTLIADILWDDLSAAQHAEIQAAFDPLIENFFTIYEEGHWALFNGNNWTPVLVNGALYWGVTYYHEDERAPELVKRALQTLWLHRDFYREDSTYEEGLSYASVSFDALLEINHMTQRVFGEPLDSVYWSRMAGTAAWSLDFMAPDGLLVDFGDSWAKRGWYNFTPLSMMLINEGDLDDPAELDPCLVKRFFTNKYYYHGMTDPFRTSPLLLRDWYSVVDKCDADSQDGQVLVSVHDEGGWGGIRTWQVGATELAQTEDHSKRYSQADQTFLAVSAIPSYFSHTELDFGSLVWTAYGNRLLLDSGYGDLNTDRYETDPDMPPDQNPTGHNTLVIPEALYDGDASTNTSQIEDSWGTIAAETVGDAEVIHLNGDTVYGSDNLELGWLSAFDRWLLHLADGHFMVIDSFAVRSDRGSAMVEERWHLGQTSPAPEDCSSRSEHSDYTIDDDTLNIQPMCAMLDTVETASQGRIVASSLQPGSFVDSGLLEFVNRLEDTEQRGRVRYVPDEAVELDIRLFALLGGSVDQELPELEYTWKTCDDAPCVDVTLAAEVWLFSFTWDEDSWILSDIEKQ